MQHKKSQITLFILLIIGLGIIALFFLPESPFKLAIVNTLDFAGFNWQTEGNVEKQGEFVILESSRTNTDGRTISGIKTDITGIDEILVIIEGDAWASAYRAGAAAGITIGVIGSESGDVGIGNGISARSSGSESGQEISKHIDARVVKLKNNFDGTWSALDSLGVGDIFIVTGSGEVKGIPRLYIQAYASNSGIANGQSGTSSIKAKIYNVIIKKDSFAICKADEFIQDVNKDGKIAIDGSECFDLKTIVLNSEEAIKESTNEKLMRIEQELLAKQIGLEQQIKELQQQNLNAQAQIDELKVTSQRLADVQAGDKNVIAVVESQEQFKEPNFIIKFINRIIAFFRNLFS